MDSTQSLNEPDFPRDGKFAPLLPESLASAEELLAKLAHEAAATTTNRPADVAEAVFSAGSRLAAVSPDIAPGPLGNNQATSELRPRGRRTMAGPFRFLLAAGIGVLATLAWQSYGAAGKRTVANLVPQLGLSSSSDVTLPLPNPVKKDSVGAVVEANVADGAPTQVAALTQSSPNPVVTPSPASAEMIERIEGVSRDIGAMRQSMEQLTAAQSEMARTIAALQAAEDARREQPASPPRPIAVHKPTKPPPQRPSQPLAPGPRPLSQSIATSPPPAPAPAPLPAEPPPPRPPGSMP
jgi:hypothetical protein